MKKYLKNGQILYTLRQTEGGIPVAEAYSKTCITEQKFYRGKWKFVGTGAAELARLRQLEDESKKTEISGRRIGE